MVRRWILYLAALLAGLIFFAAYQGWVAWIILAFILFLPGFSLAVSLLPMALARGEVTLPGAVTVGDGEALLLELTSPLPLPPNYCQYRTRHSITGQTQVLLPGDQLSTGHCGQLVCTSRGLYVYDLLGLFRLRKRLPARQILIRPRPIPTQPPRDLERHLAHAWQPKYGGGFSENHELRLYRPGDGLNQVHWKLSAKTGKLIIREAMVPKYGRILLTADLMGTPAHIDHTLGQLLWMGSHFLELGLRYTIHVHTGAGLQAHSITTEAELAAAMDSLLTCPPATGGSVRNSAPNASWQYYIGGDANEA